MGRVGKKIKIKLGCELFFVASHVNHYCGVLKYQKFAIPHPNIGSCTSHHVILCLKVDSPIVLASLLHESCNLESLIFLTWRQPIFKTKMNLEEEKQQEKISRLLWLESKVTQLGVPWMRKGKNVSTICRCGVEKLNCISEFISQQFWVGPHQKKWLVNKWKMSKVLHINKYTTHYNWLH